MESKRCALSERKWMIGANQPVPGCEEFIDRTDRERDEKFLEGSGYSLMI